MTEQVGTIISTEDTPNSDEFHFVLQEPVKKEEFVEFDTEEGRAVARVGVVRKANMFFNNAESVSESSKQGVPLSEQFPTEDRELLIGKGTVLGVYQENGLVKRPSFPPSPGTEVYDAEKDRLADFLGLDQESGINIGEVQFEDLQAQLNLTKLMQKHVAILAQSGAGKSYLASVIMEELLDRQPEEGQIATVVIDPHGEYAGFADDEAYMDRVEVYDASDIQISLANLSARKFDQYFSNVTTPQKREIKKLLGELKSEMNKGEGVFDLEELEKRVKEAEMTKKTKQIWEDRINRMKYMNLFKRYDNPSLDRVEPGKMIVLDLSDIIGYRKKQIVVEYFASKLFKARRRGKIPPYFFLVEEAHNFAPENVSSSQAIARSTIKKIAREGRKFHASLGLISQRPVGLSTTALSQCNTHIILRVTNPNDLDRIKQSSEGITSEVIKSIPGLRVGECIVVGEAVDYPTFINVRERRSQEFDTGQELESAAKEYIEKEKQEEDDIDAFM
ncbi:MAG: ATP-binding protein [Candidatus Nanohaloarchaeota archaeon QJJ-9]|nr:ATP-binding protein [Candidatus Nanohaloarchaeota archaeon QJJ-9]